jgi:hypothetical protein
MYRVSNGITRPIDVSDEEAHETYVRTDPRLRSGTYEDGFEVYPRGEFGHALTCAATRYQPRRAANADRAAVG